MCVYTCVQSICLPNNYSFVQMLKSQNTTNPRCNNFLNCCVIQRSAHGHTGTYIQMYIVVAFIDLKGHDRKCIFIWIIARASVIVAIGLKA